MTYFPFLCLVVYWASTLHASTRYPCFISDLFRQPVWARLRCILPFSPSIFCFYLLYYPAPTPSGPLCKARHRQGGRKCSTAHTNLYVLYARTAPDLQLNLPGTTLKTGSRKSLNPGRPQPATPSSGRVKLTSRFRASLAWVRPLWGPPFATVHGPSRRRQLSARGGLLRGGGDGKRAFDRSSQGQGPWRGKFATRHELR